MKHSEIDDEGETDNGMKERCTERERWEEKILGEKKLLMKQKQKQGRET